MIALSTLISQSPMSKHLIPTTGLNRPITRRSFIAGSFLVAATGVAATSIGAGWATSIAGTETWETPPEFVSISRLLTGRGIELSLVDRAWQALASRHLDFPARFARLSKALRVESISDFAQWQRSAAAADEGHRATALAIVSAWYLGVVGEVKDRAEDGPAFITYEGAFMWRPTLDVTVIPTYARGGPGTWKLKPSSLLTD